MNEVLQARKESEQKAAEYAKKAELLRKSCKELDDDVFMLKNVIETRNLEVEKLRKELDSFEATTSIVCAKCDDENGKVDDLNLDSQIQTNEDSFQVTTSSQKRFTCEQCDPVVDSEKGMEMHMKMNHEQTN